MKKPPLLHSGAVETLRQSRWREIVEAQRGVAEGIRGQRGPVAAADISGTFHDNWSRGRPEEIESELIRDNPGIVEPGDLRFHRADIRAVAAGGVGNAGDVDRAGKAALVSG